MLREMSLSVGRVASVLVVCALAVGVSLPLIYAAEKAPANKKLPVKVVKIGPEDKAGIERQKVCPVSGEKLDSMGGPIKVLVGDQPVYLCCKGCLKKVEKDPETYLRKAKRSDSNR